MCTLLHATGAWQPGEEGRARDCSEYFGLETLRYPAADTTEDMDCKGAEFSVFCVKVRGLYTQGGEIKV